MPLPLLPIAMGGLGLLNIGSQVMGQQKNQRFLERQAQRDEQLQRRAAIGRAIGQFGARPAMQRTPETMTPPNTSAYTAIAGLSNLAMALTPQFMAAMKPPVTDVQMPQTQQPMGMGNLGLNKPQNYGLSPMSDYYGTNY